MQHFDQYGHSVLSKLTLCGKNPGNQNLIYFQHISGFLWQLDNGKYIVHGMLFSAMFWDFTKFYQISVPTETAVHLAYVRIDKWSVVIFWEINWILKREKF